MNVTTGTILCNARYKKINGHDCFVNTESHWFGKRTTDNYYQLKHPSSPDFNPVSGFDSKVDFDSTITKISDKSVYVQNMYMVGFYYTNLFTKDASSDFTLAFWAYCTSLSTDSKFSVGSGSHYLDICSHNYNSSSHKIQYEYGGNNPLITSELFPSNTWVHLMLARQGNYIYAFKNGQLISSHSLGSDWGGMNDNLYIRGFASRSYYDDIVLVRGEALATSSFTVPTTYLLDKTYNDSTLTYKNIMYPLTVREAKKILPDKELLKQY